MKLKHLLPFVVMLLIMIFPVLVHAQGPDPGGDPDATVPVDGGLSILFAAGVGYGVKKLKDHRKKMNADNGIL